MTCSLNRDMAILNGDCISFSLLRLVCGEKEKVQPFRRSPNMSHYEICLELLMLALRT